MNQRRCEECNSPLKGRSDKRFCGDYCRNTYHNRKHQKRNRVRYATHQKLQRNRQILKEILGSKSRRVIGREQLIQLGFDFGFLTEILRLTRGQNYYYIYDVGYRLLEANRLLIVHKDKRPLAISS